MGKRIAMLSGWLIGLLLMIGGLYEALFGDDIWVIVPALIFGCFVIGTLGLNGRLGLLKKQKPNQGMFYRNIIGF